MFYLQIVGKWHIVEHISDLRGLNLEEIRDSVCLDLQLEHPDESRIEETWNPVSEPDYHIRFNISVKDPNEPGVWRVITDSDQSKFLRCIVDCLIMKI